MTRPLALPLALEGCPSRFSHVYRSQFWKGTVYIAARVWAGGVSQAALTLDCFLPIPWHVVPRDFSPSLKYQT